MKKDELKIRWFGETVILTLITNRGYDSPDKGSYEGDGFSFFYDVLTREWSGSFSYEVRDKHNLGGFISVNSTAPTPQRLSKKLEKNLEKLLIGLDYLRGKNDIG